jgi:transmembrane sensor
VTLYPGASLRYAAHFVQQKRELNLRGKAFFKVKHDANRPFIVYSGQVQTVVLGTSFWVDAQPSAARVRVTVKTGKVGVKTARNSTVFLLPDEQAVFIKSEGTLAKISRSKKSHKRENQYLIKSEKPALAFNETPLSQVVALLKEQFKLEIYLENESLASLHITLNTRGKSLESILEEIKAQAPVQYERKAQEIHIKENKTIK